MCRHTTPNGRLARPVLAVFTVLGCQGRASTLLPIVYRRCNTPEAMKMPENVVGRGQNQNNRVTKYGVKKLEWSPSLVSEILGGSPWQDCRPSSLPRILRLSDRRPVWRSFVGVLIYQQRRRRLCGKSMGRYRPLDILPIFCLLPVAAQSL